MHPSLSHKNNVDVIKRPDDVERRENYPRIKILTGVDIYRWISFHVALERATAGSFFLDI